MTIDSSILEKIERKELTASEADAIIMKTIDRHDDLAAKDLIKYRLPRSLFSLYKRLIPIPVRSPAGRGEMANKTPLNVFHIFMHTFSFDEINTFTSDELAQFLVPARVSFTQLMDIALSHRMPQHLASEEDLIAKYKLLSPYFDNKPSEPLQEIKMLSKIVSKVTSYQESDAEKHRQFYGNLLALAYRDGRVNRALLPYVFATSQLDKTAIYDIAVEDSFDTINEVHGVTLIDYFLWIHGNSDTHHSKDKDVDGWLAKLTGLELMGHNPEKVIANLEDIRRSDPDLYRDKAIHINTFGHLSEDRFTQLNKTGHYAEACKITQYLEEKGWYQVMPTTLVLNTGAMELPILDLASYETDRHESACAGGIFRAMREGYAPASVRRAVLYAVNDALSNRQPRTAKGMKNPEIILYKSLKFHGHIPEDHVATKKSDYRTAIITSDLFWQDKHADVIGPDNVLLFLMDHNHSAMLRKAIEYGHNPARPVQLDSPSVYYMKSWETGSYDGGNPTISLAANPSNESRVNHANLLDLYIEYLPKMFVFAPNNLSKINANHALMKTLGALLKSDPRNTFASHQSLCLTQVPATYSPILKSGKKLTYNDLSKPLPLENILLPKKYFESDDFYLTFVKHLIKETIQSGVTADSILTSCNALHDGLTVRETVAALGDDSLTAFFNNEILKTQQKGEPETQSLSRKRLKL